MERARGIRESEQKLVRAIGLKEIIALTINGIIGAGIFALPANASRILGVSSPLAFLLAGLFTAIIVLCFAELGGRFDRTGGAYLYAQEAFGGLAAFLIGWMYFLARLTSVAALSNALVGFIGYFRPIDSPLRESFLIVLLLGMAVINFWGVRSSTRILNFLTIAKIIPLLIFVGVGLTYVPWKVFSAVQLPPLKSLSEAVLILVFAFSGFEVIAVPGAEILRPNRNVPLGLLTGTAITILLYLLIQIVAVATYPGLSHSQAPLAEAAEVFLGRRGGGLLNLGAVCSTIGTLTSLLLVGPRILFAMSLNQQMPPLFSRVHPTHRTPHVSIFLFAGFAIAMALYSNFTVLATLSAMARLVTYIGSALALLVLRRKQSSPDTFRIPGGPLVPVLTVLLSLFLLTAATRTQLITGSAALGIGLLLYLLRTAKTTETAKKSQF